MTGKRSRSNRKSKSRTAIPSQVRRFALFDLRPVLEGEDATLYDDLVTRMYDALAPVDFVEEMYLADVVFLQWELMRWHRLKFNLMQASVHKELRDLLKRQLDYNVYRETFAELLAQILQESLQKNLPEDQARELAYQCADSQQEAVDKVTRLLTATHLDMDRILDDAKDHTAKELVQDYARREPDAVKLVNGLLASHGRTRDDLMVAMLSKKFDEIERIDRQIAIAEARRNVSLREIDRRRAVLGEALRRTLPEVDGEFKMIETTTPKEKNST
jgi:hypothetical protein